MAFIDQFLVKLGFAVNKDEEAKFKGATEGAIKNVKRVAMSATAIGTAVGAAVLKASSELSKMSFDSARAGTSIKNARALGVAFANVGGDASQAMSAVMGLHAKFRELPRLGASIRKNLGIEVYDKATGKLKDMSQIVLEMGKAFQKMDAARAEQVGALYGFSPDMVELLRSGKMSEEFEKALKAQREMGVDLDESGKRARQFMSDVNSMWENFKVASMDALTKLVGDQLHEMATAFPKLIGKINGWVNSLLESIKKEGVMKTLGNVIWGDGPDGNGEGSKKVRMARLDDDERQEVLDKLGVEYNGQYQTFLKRGGWQNKEKLYKEYEEYARSGKKGDFWEETAKRQAEEEERAKAGYKTPNVVTTASGERSVSSVQNSTTNTTNANRNSSVVINQNITVNGTNSTAQDVGKSAREGVVDGARRFSETKSPTD